MRICCNTTFTIMLFSQICLSIFYQNLTSIRKLVWKLKVATFHDNLKSFQIDRLIWKNYCKSECSNTGFYKGFPSLSILSNINQQTCKSAKSFKKIKFVITWRRILRKKSRMNPNFHNIIIYFNCLNFWNKNSKTGVRWYYQNILQLQSKFTEPCVQRPSLNHALSCLQLQITMAV